MNVIGIRTCLAEAVAGLELLEHPFYRRWSEGTVTRDELSSYAAQYRHFEASLPGLLGGLSLRTESQEVRSMLERNIADERGTSGGRAHLEMFDDFAEGLGVSGEAGPTPATSSLLEEHRALVARSAVSGLAGLLAYEMQLPAVATTKAAGLREHYGLPDEAVTFWDAHVETDEEHTRWGIEALVALGADREEVVTAARRAARAWWGFLDERESERVPAPA